MSKDGRMDRAANDKPYNVLFLCTGKLGAFRSWPRRFLNRLGQGRFKAYSAGSHPAGAINMQTLSLLQRMNYSTEGIALEKLGRVRRARCARRSISFSRSAIRRLRRSAPTGRASRLTAHWGLPDPAAAEGSDAERALAFADAFRMLNNRIFDLRLAPPSQPGRGCPLQDRPGCDRKKRSPAREEGLTASP